MKTSWSVEGYDTFEGGSEAFYTVSSHHETLAQAETSAKKFLEELEATQPRESSGGQSREGIQDRVYIVHPNGHKTRFLG